MKTHHIAMLVWTSAALACGGSAKSNSGPATATETQAPLATLDDEQPWPQPQQGSTIAESGNGPTCDQVVAHVMDLAEREIATRAPSEEEKQAQLAEFRKQRGQIQTNAIAQCQKDATPELLNCAMQAQSIAELDLCAPADPSPPAAGGATGAAAGGPPCDEVADHVMEIMVNNLDKIADPDEREEARKTLVDDRDKIRGKFIADCDKSATAEMKECIIKAESLAQISSCP
ncbi:MAG: hypothetical protein AAGC55_15255 [Myxococcota bacterium]